MGLKGREELYVFLKRSKTDVSRTQKPAENDVYLVMNTLCRQHTKRSAQLVSVKVDFH